MPHLGIAQNRGYHKQTCKNRLQGKWVLTESKVQGSVRDSKFQEVNINFKGDSIIWIDALFGDTLVGKFYSWTEIVEVIESSLVDPFCDDFDDDDFNDCEHEDVTTMQQQNYLKADLSSLSRTLGKGLSWDDFTLVNNTLSVRHREDGRVHHLIFTRRR